MPRDEHAVAEASTIALPGFRRARIVPADDAGQTRLLIINGDPLDQVHTLGALDRDQHAAGVRIAALYDETGLRQHLGGRYDGVLTDAGSDPVAPLERMSAEELRAWRRMHRLLAVAPLHCRGEVDAVCIRHLRPVSIARLRAGLAAIARALRSGR